MLKPKSPPGGPEVQKNLEKQDIWKCLSLGGKKKNRAKIILWKFCKNKWCCKEKTALNEKVLEVSTKAYWTPSSRIVQTWPGDCGSSGRRTARPSLWRTGAQDSGCSFPNKVTWGRIKNSMRSSFSLPNLTYFCRHVAIWSVEADANKTWQKKRC